MLRMVTSLFCSPPPAAHTTHIALVQAARNPFFFEHLGVPDTLDGRFELLALHAFLLQTRLREEAPELARQLSELLIADLDTALRELGIGDSGVKRRIKTMAKAYHGRLQVYAAALAEGEESLKTSLARNLYGTVVHGDVDLLTAMATYVMRIADTLANTPIDSFTRGTFTWPDITRIGK